MNVFYLGLGLFFVAMGFLVKVFPFAIAGYNTMSAEKRKNVDIDGLSSMMKKHLVVIGGGIFLVPTSLEWMNKPMLANIVLGIILFGGILVMLFLTPKFDNNQYSAIRKRLPFLLVFLIFGGVAVAISTGITAPDTHIANNEITISGQYGLTQKVRDIELLESIPRIIKKKNGFGFGGIKKGKFSLENWGTCTLFLQNKQGPFIKVSTDQKKILINLKKPEETMTLFTHLKNQLTK